MAISQQCESICHLHGGNLLNRTPPTLYVWKLQNSCAGVIACECESICSLHGGNLVCMGVTNLVLPIPHSTEFLSNHVIFRTTSSEDTKSGCHNNMY